MKACLTSACVLALASVVLVGLVSAAQLPVSTCSSSSRTACSMAYAQTAVGAIVDEISQIKALGCDIEWGCEALEQYYASLHVDSNGFYPFVFESFSVTFDDQCFVPECQDPTNYVREFSASSTIVLGH